MAAVVVGKGIAIVDGKVIMVKAYIEVI